MTPPSLPNVTTFYTFYTYMTHIPCSIRSIQQLFSVVVSNCCSVTQCYSRVAEEERHAPTRYDFFVHNLRLHIKSSVGNIIALGKKAFWTAMIDILAIGTRAVSPYRNGQGAVKGRIYFPSFIATTAVDGTTKPVSRDQVLRRERGQGRVNFPCSADHVQDWQLYPVDPYPCHMCDHTNTYGTALYLLFEGYLALYNARK